MSKFVLDASVLLALLNDEPGAEIFARQPRLLPNSTICAVNLSEAYGKLISLRTDPDEAWEAITAPLSEVIAFDAELARLAGRLVSSTRSAGLSLGDRACLALGIALKAPVYTADRAWKSLKVGVAIHVIR